MTSENLQNYYRDNINDGDNNGSNGKSFNIKHKQ